MKDFPLFLRIIAFSEHDEWELARREWEWVNTYLIDEYEECDTCMCGHPIRDVCVIVNRLNRIQTIVGNCCIKKFMENEADLVFQCIKRLHANIDNPLNPATLEYSYRKGIIDEWERRYYRDTWRKRNLTKKQYAVRLGINERVLSRFRKRTAVKERNSIFDF